MRALAIQAIAAGFVIAGCFTLALWLGLIVTGVLLGLFAEALDNSE